MHGHELEDAGWLAAQLTAQLGEPSIVLIAGALCAIVIFFLLVRIAIRIWGDPSFLQ